MEGYSDVNWIIENLDVKFTIRYNILLRGVVISWGFKTNYNIKKQWNLSQLR